MSKESPQLSLLVSPGSISSSRAFRARTSARPTPTAPDSTESDPACSGGASMPSTPSSPESSSSRTSVDSFNGVWTSLSTSSPNVVSRWSALGSVLPTSEPPTSGSESSSWATPTASNSKGAAGSGFADRDLAREAEAWPTGSAWPTPLRSDGQNGGTRGKGAQGGPNLREAATEAAHWPTPAASNPNDGEGRESWEARRQRLIEKGYNRNGMGEPLGMAVRDWPTPTAGDRKSAGNRGGDSHTGTSLCDATERSREPWALALQEESSHRGPLRLSPAWVEQLMGFPPGWVGTHGPPLVDWTPTPASPRASSSTSEAGESSSGASGTPSSLSAATSSDGG